MTPERDDLADALRRLHQPDVGVGALDRRRFLQLVGLGVGAGVMGGALPTFELAERFGQSAHAAPLTPDQGILVVIGMYGGNDGLDTVIAPGDSTYQAQRGALALGSSSVLPITPEFGLHHELTALHEFWQAGQLAVVDGIGYPNPDLSHFNSMAYWMSAMPAGFPSSGWIGRWMDGVTGGNKDLYVAGEVGSALPLALRGLTVSGSVIPAVRPSFGGSSSQRERRMYSTLKALRNDASNALGRRVGDALADQIDMADRLMPHYGEPVLRPGIDTKLEVAARMINANLGFRVLTVGWHDFDSHAGQPLMHSTRMRELNAAIRRFYAVLDPAWSNRVTAMTFSEFGRTPWSNLGDGTDHGTAAPHFVFGPNVRGGLYGQRPSSAGLGRWDRTGHTVDFRSYYASVIDGWLGGGSSEVLGREYEDLHLFQRGPGIEPGGGVTPMPISVTAASSFSPLVPQRIVDTRDGFGAPRGPLAPDSSIVVQVTGVAGVPNDGVSAVVINVTAADATTPMFFTVYPHGISPPMASTLNGSPGRPVPNLAVVKLGVGGKIDVYNSHGNTHCIVDVFGYFGATGGNGFFPVSPQRVLDTRIGHGSSQGPLASGEAIELQLNGLAGIPEFGATAVVMNLTATNTMSPGFLRTTPSGNSPAMTSNVNFFTGDTVANLVVCQLGPDGRVSIDAFGDSTDVVADVFGYFGTAGELVRTVTPTRLVDTRSGVGAPMQRIGPNFSVQLPVRGIGSVSPTATAVIVNITATNVERPSFITVWPGSEERPNTSNLNMLPGQTLANLVFCRLGANGDLMITNPLGECDLIVDLLGFFER